MTLGETLNREVPSTEHTKATFRSYLIYRVLLATLLFALYMGDAGPSNLGSYAPRLYVTVAPVYLTLALFSLSVDYLGQLNRAGQCYFAILVDIVSIVCMMHASGGVPSGLGTLLAISIALASLSLAGKTALLFAALATLGVLAEQFYSQTSGSLAPTAYTHAGLLGTSFFALALLAHQLSRRVSESEQLAHQRGFDLANLAELNDYVIQHMQTGVVVVDEKKVIRLINEAAWYLLGMPDNVRRSPLRGASSELDESLLAWQKDPGHDGVEFHAVGGGRELQATFTSLGEQGDQGFLIFLEDMATVTERAQQLKLASLGQLTASIAHEIRNPLGAISHAAQLLNESPEIAKTDRRMAEIIHQNTQRLNQVVENILNLSKRERGHVKPLVLGPWLRKELFDLARNCDIDDDQLQLAVDPEATTVYVDPGQMRQIIAILFDNAIKHFGGRIDALKIGVFAGITRKSGGPVLDFMDNGPGISTENVSKLFEPFFTTRNDGTGLGLYVARELSETNRVRLEYLPLPAGGSCFRLSFPDPRSRELPR